MRCVNTSRISMTIAAALLLAACSTGAGTTAAQVAHPGGDSTSQPVDAVVINTFMFKPSPLQVSVGATVTWTNQDQIDHTVTSGTPKHATDAFDGTLPHQGATFRTTFSKPGTYPYFCRIHNVMRGEIVVTA